MGNLSKSFGKLTIPLLVLLAISFWALPAQAKYGGGTGEPNDPYLIFDANQMNAIGADSNDWDKHFLLCADIDLSAYTGTQFNVIGRFEGWSPTDIPFSGVFDGNSHTISNFTWNSTDYGNNIGLFVFLGDSGHIKDLGLENVNVNAADSYYVGSLVGFNNGGNIQGCYSNGSVTAYHSVGGLVGHNYNQGTINGCHSATNVSGQRSVGGLVGENYYGAITDCNSTGTITGERYVGGLVGKLEGNSGSGTIKDCHSTATVSGKHDIGGLVGRSGGLITDCYATGSVQGWWSTGGLVGGNTRHSTISDCYSTATVSGDWFTGGLVGSNGGKITNCYSTSSVYGSSRHFAGLVGSNGGMITACYSTGAVSGTANVSGGLVGKNESGTISNCYSTASVDANDYVGGLVGNNPYGIIINSYCTGEVTGNLYVGGLLGVGGGTINCFWDIETSGQTTSAGGTPKTTDQMKNLNTFPYWGACGNQGVWTINDGNDYPRLAWQNISGVLIVTSEPVYGGGCGTEADPYQIWTAEQLNKIGLIPCHWDKHFLLCADIELSAYTGASFNIIGYVIGYVIGFSGVFDGNGHIISNFSYISTDTSFIGLFGYVTGEIRALGLIDPNIDVGTGDYVGLLVGRLRKGTITNCYVQGGSISGRYNVGGLVGYSGGDIRDCYATGSVFGEQHVGGLVGYNENSIIDCYTSGNVTGGNNSSYIGGLCGKSVGPHHGTGQSRIQNCFSKATVTGNDSVGGLIGHNGRTVTGCYSTGTVIGRDNNSWSIGGLIGRNGGHGSIINCFSTGTVSGDERVGGLVGDNDGTGVVASFWDIETSGQTSSTGGTGLPTDQMQMQNTFTDAGWDFVGETSNGIEDIWFIPRQDYPHLWWEGMQVPMKLTPRTLNCRSYGNWVKAHLTLPEGFTVADVDPNRPAVLHSFGFESAPLYVFVNENERVQIEAAFEREAAVCSLTGDWPQALTVAGFLTDGNIFLGTSTVRMITPGLKDIGELALYWLNADCVQPDFCDGIDMNRDSMVNLLDYALLLNSQVEFVSE